MSDDAGSALAYLVIIIVAVVVIIGTILSIGIFILGAIVVAGLVGGFFQGTANFLAVLKEAHDKLP